MGVRGKKAEETWRKWGPFWRAGLAALFLAGAFRLGGLLEASRGVAFFHGILLLVFLGSTFPRKEGKARGSHADTFLAFGLETAFFFYSAGTLPEFVDSGLLFLQKGGHDPYFPVWIWAGTVLRLGAVGLGLSLARTERGSLAWAPWDHAQDPGTARSRWRPPEVKAPPMGPSAPPIPLVEAVERVTWGLAGPLGDLEEVLEGLLEEGALSEEARERLERARAEARWCWKQVENLGRLIPAEISLDGQASSRREEAPAPADPGRKEEPAPSGPPQGEGCFREEEEEEPSRRGSVFLVHLAEGEKREAAPSARASLEAEGGEGGEKFLGDPPA